MKYVLALIVLILVGCSAQPTPLTTVESDWSDYGKGRAEQGLMKQSEAKLAKLDTTGAFSNELYLAYDNGYEEGRQTYCAQSAYMLGVIGKPYLGLCDKIDPFFYQDYVSGKNSTAGSAF